MDAAHGWFSRQFRRWERTKQSPPRIRTDERGLCFDNLAFCVFTCARVMFNFLFFQRKGTV